MSGEFLGALGDELRAAGIRGQRRDRIVAEYADHLQCDPDAQLGSPSELAHQFADELGTSRARHGVVASFAALAVAGVMFAVAIGLGVRFHAFRSSEVGWSPLGQFGLGLAAIAAQVAFATGVLAALRAFWSRRAGVLTRTEATILVRRVVIAIAAGLVAMLGLGLMAIGIRHFNPSVPGWRTYAAIAASVGAGLLLASAPVALAAARVRPTAAGEGGDVLDDLGPLTPSWLRGRPWRFALLVAAALAAAIAVQGAVVSDPYDGILRGIMEALACLVGFAALGRYIGLVQPAATAGS